MAGRRLELFGRLVTWLLILLFIFPQQSAYGMSESVEGLTSNWEYVTNGIDLQIYHVNNPRPVNLFVARMDRGNPSTIIESSIAQGKINSGRETISGMADRYNQAINYWGETWGGRNRVVVAINGYFFDGATGTPWSGQIHSGWYSKRFDNYIADAGFAWTVHRTAHIGACVYHTGTKNIITFTKTGYNPSIRSVNIPRQEEELILYTPQYGANTGTTSTSSDPLMEILIEMTRPSLILPSPAKSIGYIREIRDRSGSTSLPFDHIVITSWGDVRGTMLGKIASGEIAIGDQVGISQEITDCTSSPRQEWTKSYASIGGDYHYLSNGVIRTDFNNPDASVRNSRTAIAFNDSYIYFIVVDAFDPGESEGMTISQLADFSKNTLLANWGVTLDSGTSSTMVINGEVVNNTFCNFTRDCGMALGDDAQYLQDALVLPPEQTYKTEWDDITGALEPLVGNGMLMVITEPAVKSVTFIPGTEVVTRDSTSVRLGPGSNYAMVGNIPAGSTGIILSHRNGLNGILAKGSYWWKMDIQGLTGWVREDDLHQGMTPPPQLFLPIIRNYTNALNRNEYARTRLKDKMDNRPRISNAEIARR